MTATPHDDRPLNNLIVDQYGAVIGRVIDRGYRCDAFCGDVHLGRFDRLEDAWAAVSRYNGGSR
jgi:hypothetical protein